MNFILFMTKILIGNTVEFCKSNTHVGNFLIFVICAILVVTSYGTEFRKVTKDEWRSIQQETCDVIRKEINAGFFRDVLLFSDSSQLKLLQNFGKSDKSYFDTDKIIKISDCEIEMFLDSITFMRIMKKINLEGFKLFDTGIKISFPKNIRIDSMANISTVNDKVEYAVQDYEKGRIILLMVNSNIIVRHGNNVVHGSRFLEMKIRHGRYLEAKNH